MIKIPETIKEWATLLGIVGGLVPLIGGAWALSEMLHQGKEAYAQVRDLKDDVQDLEKRYNAHIESAWKKYKVEEAERQKLEAKRGAPLPSMEVPDEQPEERDNRTQ